MTSIVDFIHGLKFETLTNEVIDAAHRALTDTLGVAVAASTIELSAIIHNHATSQFGAGSDGKASLWQDGRSVSPAGAALANGMTIDALDAHDGYKPAKGHVGCGVIPALIAMAEATGNDDPQEFITSLIMGYEIGSRAGDALHATACDYHTSGAWVALATAAIAARYLKLTSQQTKEALGIAEYHGPRSQMMRTIDHPTMVKDGSGWGAMAGISAAYLARDGFTGAPAISMEAEAVAKFWDNLGKRWLVQEQYIKLYPVCRWAQPPVEAVLAIRREHSFGLDDIKSIKIITFHESLRLATKHPTTTEQAQYSLPYPVSVALVHGTITATHVSNEALSDPTMTAIRDKIEVVESDAFNKEFPARRIAQVEIELMDGRLLASEPTEAIGDPENPVSDQVIREKFTALTHPILGAEKSGELFHITQNMAFAKTVCPLFTALSTPSSKS
ncbi:MAG: MmgE/PrpD family protein [Rhizobiaceae bacterium]